MTALKLQRPEPTEAQVQASVLRYLQRHPQVVWVARMNSAAGRLTRGTGGRETSQFMRFGFKGCPDIHGMLKGGRALYVEVKRPSGKLTPEQAAFLQRAATHGGCAFVARGIDDCERGLHESVVA